MGSVIRRVKFRFVFLPFISLLIGHGVANACTCGGSPTVSDSYTKADAAFTGVVQRIERLGPKEESESGKEFYGEIAHVLVGETFKGRTESELVFTMPRTSCDPVYKEGQHWLFYAYHDKVNDRWSIQACDRSSLAEFAAADLLYLRGLPSSATRTRLSGTLYHYENDPIKGFTLVGYLIGVRVRLIGPKKTYEVYTDTNGVYEIYGIPPGKYAIEPDIPPGLKVSFPVYSGVLDDSDTQTTKIVLKAKSCGGANFIFKSDAQISGEVIGVDGRPMTQVCLTLLLKGQAFADRHFFNCTDKEGHYTVDEIPPGEYFIVANGDGWISGDVPFPKTYYPGVFDKEKATTVVVDYGAKLEDYDIQIPAQEPTIVIQGVLLYADGKPVDKGFVSFKLDSAKEGYQTESRDVTDAQGHFSLTVIQGLNGHLIGSIYAYSGEYENCPYLENLIDANGGRFATTETKPISVETSNDTQGIRLSLPFSHCAKAKVD